MKLRNKKTGEIVEVESLYLTQTQELYLNYINEENKQKVYTTDKIASFNLDWEDYEEPNIYCFIDIHGEVKQMEDLSLDWQNKMKQIGNYFETKEEAENAVEKLKAWKRLKDNGFRLNAVVDTFFSLDIYMKGEPYEAIKDDLKIVFGDEK